MAMYFYTLSNAALYCFFNIFHSDLFCIDIPYKYAYNSIFKQHSKNIIRMSHRNAHKHFHLLFQLKSNMERKKRIIFHFAYCVELSLNTICISMHYYNNKNEKKKAMNEERTGKWLMNCELCMLNCNAQNIIRYLFFCSKFRLNV